ncbi:MAG: lipid kinase [Bacteroidaceae bacterium]|nr:lipid kinase [Bacteroidaceae bacterium]MBO4590537.1 lipid kinase [Bacteroidaceae bacterium]MBR5964101.1 lipid kinase [Bacteroidaceae bacterium]
MSTTTNDISTRWGIIYVPMAGTRNRHKRWQQIREILDQKEVQYDYIQSENYGSVERLARMLVNNGYKIVVVVGGDRAVNEALNGIMTSSVENLEDVSLAIIANGVGNDFADFWGLGVDEYKKAIDCIIKGNTRKIDVGYVSFMNGEEMVKRYFLMAVNIGLGARAIEISDFCKQFWGKANPTYIISMIRLFTRRNQYKMHFKVNETVINEKIMTLCVGNSRGYGMTPSAVPYNGWLDVSVIYRPKFWQMVHGLRMLLKGRLLNHEQVRPFRTKKFVLYDSQNASICVDGKKLDYTLPMEINLMPEFLNFIVP